MKPCVLVLAEVYLPGYLAGGPVRSLVNLIDQLSDEFHWKVITTDRDFNSPSPYAGVQADCWRQVGSAEVYYASPRALGAQRLLRLIRETQHDLLYLNSFFSPRFSIFPMLARKFHVLPRLPVLIAPRGEFSNGAYRLKRWKKAPFVALSRALRMHADANWHASTDLEAADICRILATESTRVHVASNLLEPIVSDNSATVQRCGTELRVCFLSRISRMKNLDFALRVLAEVRQPIVFTVYGPKEDDQYWAECEALVRRLPPNIRFDYAGPLSHEKVYAELMKHDLFFLPTRGENYGHVLVEAWSAGLPVLTSDQTPWRGLAEKGIGWDLALSAIEDFVHVIEEVATLDDKTRAQCQVRCKSFIADRVGMEVEILNNRAMFLACLRLSS